MQTSTQLLLKQKEHSQKTLRLVVTPCYIPYYRVRQPHTLLIFFSFFLALTLWRHFDRWLKWRLKFSQMDFGWGHLKRSPCFMESKWSRGWLESRATFEMKRKAKGAQVESCCLLVSVILPLVSDLSYVCVSSPPTSSRQQPLFALMHLSENDSWEVFWEFFNERVVRPSSLIPLLSTGTGGMHLMLHVQLLTKCITNVDVFFCCW